MHCDFLCLQELWLINSNLHKLNNIHTDYTYVATSGMNASSHFISGRLFGGVGILFKKSLSPHIKNIVCNSKGVFGILITMHNNFTCMLLSIYMPGNNYSMSSVRPEFSDTLELYEKKRTIKNYILNVDIAITPRLSNLIILLMVVRNYFCIYLYYLEQCLFMVITHLIYCILLIVMLRFVVGIITCLDKRDTHLEYLKNFISRNNLYLSWDHSASNKDYTYTNFSLGHKSCINHFLLVKIYLKKLKIIMLYLMLIINLIIML